MAMEINNPLYKKQGIHVISSIFTIDRGVLKVLLIKRKNEPYKNKWALVGGALYNNENLEDGLKREIFEKAGIKDIPLELVNVYGDLNRSPVMRMVAISYMGVIDINSVNILRETQKTSNADWVNVNLIKNLAYDHETILNDALKNLKKRIINTNILESLFPNGFTMPEIQKTYEAILEKNFDRRNFRRKLLSLNLIEYTGKTIKFEGNKPAKLYKFIKSNENKNVF